MQTGSIGLYGPPQDTDILRKMHSIIYDGNVIEVGPSSMFAFCCRAADSFGREFSSKPGNAFMGFNGDLSFPTELYEDLRYIFQTITKDIIQRGKIEKEHKDLFINEIDKLIQNVEKRYNDPDLSDRIGSYLLEYKDLFRVFV